MLTENDDDSMPMRARTLTTRDWKLTRYWGTDEGELYDRRRDPDECRNLWDSADHANLKSSLLAQLLEQVVCATETANGRRQPPIPPVPKWLPGRTGRVTT